eukprot:CAMPEP_0172312408 /NCGR_PEP_ID=MMETSP1058-20130122/17422_1 /TAXON_ID=83371 /ORGANISM="Detonula confervacea, Strain CCMP 353" /LENGTH=464 /DNA_ID=CAMNT_0013025853 /DNA_START=321 /DNA_END=1715 /DNA_ORIENTATION=-
MHNARPVPRDSHHLTPVAIAAMDFDDSAVITHERKLSVETDVSTNIANEDKDGESPAAASWVGRKVDAIFSPVLSFLQGATNSTSSCDGADEGNTGGSQTQPNDLEEKEVESFTCAKDSDDHDGVVSSIVREALRQAKSDMRKEDNCCSCTITSNGFEIIKHLPENYDSIPTMTNAVVDVDGDVTMAELPKLHCSQEVAANVNNYDLPASVHSCEYYEEKLRIATATNNHSVSAGGYDDDDDEDEFNPYLFIKCLPPYQHATPLGWTSRPKALPPLDYAVKVPIPPICLVLDLDETLVHCTVEPVADADIIFPVEFNGTEYQVHVRCRPFLRQFLEAVSVKFEVVIFTASQQVYADKLLDKIDPEGKFIRHRMFRDSCLPVEGNFLKDLTILGRDLSKAVLVDNSPHAFGYQVDNGIPIESWFDNPHDKELLKLEIFLRSLHGVEDVRDVVRKTFQTHQLVLDA